jgi:hypothetical protein
MDQNGYDFITNIDQKSTPGVATKKQKIIFGIIVGIVLIIFIIIGYNMLIGSKKSTQEILLPVVATQSDLSDLSELGLKSIRETATLNDATTTVLVLKTHSSALSPYLGKDGTKLSETYRNKDYVTKLEEATKSGNYDSTYKTLYSNRLDLYRQNLVTAYGQANTKKLKSQLEKMLAEADRLAGEPATPQN